jgi:hypothetical protein
VQFRVHHLDEFTDARAIAPSYLVEEPTDRVVR